MAVIVGWYYLHQNGELIYKKEIGRTEQELLESDFVKCYWECIPSSRENAWTILVEALAMGANRNRVYELASKWGCTNDDAVIFAPKIGIQLTKIYESEWHAVNGHDRLGMTGKMALDAMASLCRVCADGKISNLEKRKGK